LRLISLCQAAADGDATALRHAQALDRALAVLSGFDEGPDLVLFYKRLMVLEGNPEYAHHIDSSDALTPEQTDYVDAQWRKFRDWWDDSAVDVTRFPA